MGNENYAAILTMPEAQSPWQPNKLDANCFSHLLEFFDLQNVTDWPTLQWLNTLAEVSQNQRKKADEMSFICDSNVTSSLYYEQYIHETGKIPTRPNNWHDLFNALIWTLFPKTKRLINQCHVEDINLHGLSPRTHQRNRMTQFDECGVVLAYSSPTVPSLLIEHQWQASFWQHREQWGTQIQPFMFGHANYEMMLEPHIGLTGKWLAVQVPQDFWNKPLHQQYQSIDETLYQQLQTTQLFQDKGKFAPLPLLGIPGWYPQNQAQTFYQMTDYFRPKSHNNTYASIRHLSLVGTDAFVN